MNHQEHSQQGQSGYGQPYHSHPQPHWSAAAQSTSAQNAVQAAVQNHYAATQSAAMQGQPEFGAPPAYAHHQQTQPQYAQGAVGQGQAGPTGQGGTQLPPASDGGGRFGAVVNYAGAAVSLALIVGLGVWGYQLAMRDVTGIPVVRALEGPMRIQPVEPGGQSAAHQGLAVNSVQADGQASAPSDRVALAPAPEILSAEDQPATDTKMQTPVASLPGDDTPVLDPIEVAAKTPEISATPAAVDMSNLPEDPVAVALAIANQVSQNIRPLSGSSLADTGSGSSTGAEVTRVAAQSPVSLPNVAPKGPKIIPASVPGLAKSARPAVRPANLTTSAPVQASAEVAAVSAAKEVDPSAIPAGTRLVQLGAFDSADVARSEWDKLSIRFEDYLPSKTRVIQKAQSGGKTFYRLRAMGFKDLADARRFCSALMAGKTACIPVVTR